MYISGLRDYTLKFCLNLFLAGFNRRIGTLVKISFLLIYSQCHGCFPKDTYWWWLWWCNLTCITEPLGSMQELPTCMNYLCIVLNHQNNFRSTKNQLLLLVTRKEKRNKMVDPRWTSFEQLDWFYQWMTPFSVLW